MLYESQGARGPAALVILELPSPEHLFPHLSLPPVAPPWYDRSHRAHIICNSPMVSLHDYECCTRESRNEKREKKTRS